MTRETLVRAIRLGIKKGGSAELIADAIEMALELEQAEAPQDDPSPPKIASLAPPPSNESVIPAKELDSVDEMTKVTLDNIKRETNSGSNPVELRPGLIILAEDGDVAKEIQSRNTPKPATVKRIRSLFPQRNPKMRMDEAVQFWTDNAPETIDVLPDGREKMVRLERSVSALPGMNGKGGDFVKLSYKHPSVGDEMEVSHAVAVTDMERGIDTEAVMQKLISSAKKVYRPRPASIAPTMPAPPDLSYTVAGRDGRGIEEGTPQDQDRYAAAARQGKGAVAALKEQITKG